MGDLGFDKRIDLLLHIIGDIHELAADDNMFEHLVLYDPSDLECDAGDKFQLRFALNFP